MAEGKMAKMPQYRENVEGQMIYPTIRVDFAVRQDVAVYDDFACLEAVRVSRIDANEISTCEMARRGCRNEGKKIP
jgi:hypothetical protein